MSHCEYCKWFESDDDQDMQNGTCVFKPPVVHVIRNEAYSFFPEVNREDRCSRYEDMFQDE